MKHSDEFDMPEETTKGKKGFYVALALCLVAVCGVALTTFVSSLPGGTTQPEAGVTSTTTTKTVQQAATPVTDVTDTRTTVNKPTTTTAPVKEDLFVLPISNRVLRAYSEVHAYSKTLDAWITHNGVDFAAELGSEVKATADGTVTAIRQDALWGAVIEIQHAGNVVSRYCGVKPGSVKEGQAVKRGAVIGTLQEIPSEILDKPHLHLEMTVNGKYMDPLTLIQGEVVLEKTDA